MYLAVSLDYNEDLSSPSVTNQRPAGTIKEKTFLSTKEGKGQGTLHWWLDNSSSEVKIIHW